MTDPYKTLGVERGAGADEIKRAHRDLAKQLHQLGRASGRERG